MQRHYCGHRREIGARQHLRQVQKSTGRRRCELQRHALVRCVTQCDNFHRSGGDGGSGWGRGRRRKRQSGRSGRGCDSRLEEGSVNLQTNMRNIEQQNQTPRKRARTVDTTASVRTYHISLVRVYMCARTHTPRGKWCSRLVSSAAPSSKMRVAPSSSRKHEADAPSPSTCCAGVCLVSRGAEEEGPGGVNINSLDSKSI